MTEQQRAVRQQAWEAEQEAATRQRQAELDVAAAARTRVSGRIGASEHDPGSPLLPTLGRERGTEPEPPVYGLR